MNARDVLLGAGLVLWLQWVTSPNRPRNEDEERIRRGEVKAWLIIRLRMNERAAHWIARHLPKAWL